MVFSFPSLSVFSAKDNKNQQIAFYSFSLSNYWNIFTNYRNVNVSLKPLSLSFEEIKEMMCMKRMVFSFSFLLFVSGINAQITLEECQRKTQENYPLVHQYGLVEKTKEYNIENAAKGYLPQFVLSAKASYQSEVTEIPVKLSGVDLKGLPKDQYQVMLELQQKIWDGGGIRMQKKQTTAEAEIEKEKLNVDMYALNSRVNDLYFGILLLDEQLKQNALLQDELERNYRQITAYVENGIANQADLDAVKVEQLNTKQKRVELVSSRMAYLKMLSLLVGEKLSQETVLEKPVPQDDISAVSEIRRPELSLFNAQGVGLQVQEKALNVRHLPQFGLFVQGAYGNPGLNMLKNEFSPYYIAGVRLSWNFGSLYTLKNDRKVIENKRRQLDNNRDVFLFNTRLEMTQQDQAIQSLEKQMQDDDEIIRLRTNIRKSAEAKVANGTLTVTEMLRELTNESLARQSKALHEIQRLMGIYQLKYTTND
jgi:outer membrane protein TolC